MINHIDSGNKDSIMAIMRSFSVCLAIILQENLEGPIGAYTKKKGLRIQLNTKAAILGNITELLCDPTYEDGYKELIASLPASKIKLFNDALDMAQKLPMESRLRVSELMETLAAGNNDFLTEMFEDLEFESPEVKDICSDLIIEQIPAALKSQLNAVDTAVYGTSSYATHPYASAYHGGYAHLWGGITYGKETISDLEIINNRIRVQQAFAAGIRNSNGVFWAFKNPKLGFTVSEIDQILQAANTCPGNDFDEKMFRAAARLSVQSQVAFDKVARVN